MNSFHNCHTLPIVSDLASNSTQISIPLPNHSARISCSCMYPIKSNNVISHYHHVVTTCAHGLLMRARRRRGTAGAFARAFHRRDLRGTPVSREHTFNLIKLRTGGVASLLHDSHNSKSRAQKFLERAVVLVRRSRALLEAYPRTLDHPHLVFFDTFFTLIIQWRLALGHDIRVKPLDLGHPLHDAP